MSRAGFYIGDTGDTYLCESEEKVGNIRKNSLANLWTKIDLIKNKKYGENRWKGQCFEKRKCGIIPPNYDRYVNEKVKYFIKQNQEKFSVKALSRPLHKIRSTISFQ
ncbi:MAG: SPASM domain-containing protein [Promethearchaeota archaeon]